MPDELSQDERDALVAARRGKGVEVHTRSFEAGWLDHRTWMRAQEGDGGLEIHDEARAIAAEKEVKQLREENAKLERVWEMDQEHMTELLKSRRNAWEDLEKAEAEVKHLHNRIGEYGRNTVKLLGEYERSQARVQELERIVVDALPQLKAIAAALTPVAAQPADPDHAQFRENAEKEIARLRDRLRSAKGEIHRRKRDQDRLSKIASEAARRALNAESSVAWPGFIDVLRDAQQFADIGELRAAVEVRPRPDHASKPGDDDE